MITVNIDGIDGHIQVDKHTPTERNSIVSVIRIIDAHVKDEFHLTKKEALELAAALEKAAKGDSDE